MTAAENLLHLTSTTSTMDEARRLIEQGDTSTEIVLADEQTAGRGRHNRPWITFPAPFGMAANFIVRPQVGPHFPLIVALAVHEALTQSRTHPTTQSQTLAIKWPNDILLGGKKAAGILCENINVLPTQNVPRTTQNASIVGIGINLQKPREVPESFQGTFLNLEIAPQAMALRINACLKGWLTLYKAEGWTERLHSAYVQNCVTLGQTITWQRGQPNELTGYARSLTKDGHLEMVAEDGTVRVIHSGEIFDKR